MSDSYPTNHSSAANNPWFSISIGLICAMVGFGVGTLRNGQTAITTVQAGDQIAQIPDVPNVPAEPSNFDPPSADDDPTLGDDGAEVTLIEFTDYQCPFCQRHFNDTFAQIKQEYIDTGKIKYVVRDYPLSFHPNAMPAALASECADDQDKYWEMHDKLFEGTGVWSNLPDATATFKQYAADLKLNTSVFNTCLDSKEHEAEVNQDLADGSASGVNGTPGFWVIGPDGTGQQISGAVPFANFKQAIDSML